LVGAGYTDINIMLKAYNIAMWLVIAVVLVAYVFIERNKIKKAIITMAIVPVFWGVVYISIWGTQFFVVTPNEIAGCLFFFRGNYYFCDMRIVFCPLSNNRKRVYSQIKFTNFHFQTNLSRFHLPYTLLGAQ